MGAPLRDDVDGAALDASVWRPHDLPAWSSRAATAASHRWLTHR